MLSKVCHFTLNSLIIETMLEDSILFQNTCFKRKAFSQEKLWPATKHRFGSIFTLINQINKFGKKDSQSYWCSLTDHQTTGCSVKLIQRFHAVITFFIGFNNS